jgi:hypothetical protein
VGREPGDETPIRGDDGERLGVARSPGQLHDPVVGRVATRAAGEVDLQRTAGERDERRVGAAVEHQDDVDRGLVARERRGVPAPLGDVLHEARRRAGRIVPPSVRSGTDHVVRIHDPAHEALCQL